MPPLVYLEQSPPLAWARQVECLWSIQTQMAATNPVPPDGCLDIVFSPAFGLRVVGAMTVSKTVSLPARSYIAGIRFNPGMARSLIAITASALTDAVASAERPCREWSRKLEDAGSASQLLHVLPQLLSAPPEKPNELQRAIACITSSRGAVKLDDVIRQTGLSARQFRRRVLEESGLTPKLLCRILRFRRARERSLASPAPDWAAIAIDSGYFDQSHLIRDFLEFTGQTPHMSVLSNTEESPKLYADGTS